MDRNQRLEQNFDIQPQQGIGLNPPTPGGEARNPVPFGDEAQHVKGMLDKQAEIEQTVGETDESEEQLEDAEPVESGEETGEQQEAEHWQMHANDFAEAAGISKQEIHENVMYSTPHGKKNATSIISENSELHRQAEDWQTERQQLQEKLQQAAGSAVTQTMSPEAQRLLLHADFLEQQYGQIQWDQIPAEQRADLKIEYDRNINGMRRQAQQKQDEFLGQLDEKRRTYAADVDRQIRRDIPEWNSRDVYQKETAAITDFLRTQYGMPDQQLSAIAMDPVSMRVVRDLWQLSGKVAHIKDGAKKIRKISKSVSPGARRGKPKTSMADVGKRVREAESRFERQKIRMEAQIER